ncbi:MAG TPA: L,D-transpeptidase family protein [Blastocatellia bacterium]|nr:L,D-transpeptidase family protein [Blastocatellia bacterium]
MNILHPNTLFVSLLFVSLMIMAPVQSANAQHGAERRRNGATEARYRILIRKGERKLYLYVMDGNKERLAKTYQIALGNNPTGTKLRQGDGATPEGDYYITHKNPRSNFYLSLGVSYPNIIDANKGLKDGLITKAQHKAIVDAVNTGAKPPQNTSLGGDIFIHGGGTGKLFGLIRDWTLGCVALENNEIKELFETVPVRTPVKIIP